MSMFIVLKTMQVFSDTFESDEWWTVVALFLSTASEKTSWFPKSDPTYKEFDFSFDCALSVQRNYE